MPLDKHLSSTSLFSRSYPRNKRHRPYLQESHRLLKRLVSLPADTQICSTQLVRYGHDQSSVYPQGPAQMPSPNLTYRQSCPLSHSGREGSHGKVSPNLPHQLTSLFNSQVTAPITTTTPCSLRTGSYLCRCTWYSTNTGAHGDELGRQTSRGPRTYLTAIAPQHLEYRGHSVNDCLNCWLTDQKFKEQAQQRRS